MAALTGWECLAAGLLLHLVKLNGLVLVLLLLLVVVLLLVRLSCCCCCC
jgi:hypothetical protein